MLYKGLVLNRLGRMLTVQCVPVPWNRFHCSDCSHLCHLHCRCKIPETKWVHSNEVTGSDKAHLFPFSGKWYRGVPNHTQSKRFYVSEALGAGENSHAVAVPLPMAAAVLPRRGLDLRLTFIWKFSALEFVPSSALYLPQKAGEKDTAKLKRLSIVPPLLRSLAVKLRLLQPGFKTSFL